MVTMMTISFARISTLAVRQGFSLRLTLFIVFVSLFPEIRTQTSLPGNPILSIIDAKNEGDTVTLTCTSYGGNPLPTVRWYKNTQLVDPGSSPNGNGDGVFTVGSTTATYNNYTFQVSRSDNAVSYICKVNSSLLSSELTRSLRIEVYVPSDNPVISGPTASAALDANKNYNHTCTAANGYPVVNIVWRIGTSFGTSQDLSQGVSGRTFRISESTTTNSDSTFTKVSVMSWTPITADNGNILFCVTTQLTAPGGSVPNITKSTNVLISVQQIPILQVLNTSYTVEVGQAVTIVSALPPATNVFWNRFVNGVYNRVAIDNARYFGSSVSNPNLTITDVALSDATTYQCSATNNAGTGNSGMTLLTVTGS